MVTGFRLALIAAPAVLLAGACAGDDDSRTDSDEDTQVEPDEPGGGGDDAPDDDGDGDGDDDVDVIDEDALDEEGCPNLFAQDILPAWRVTLSDEEWAALQDEFYNWEQRDAQGLELNPYHPVEQLTYDDGSGPVDVPDVLIRLKGQSSWAQTVELDENPKMQFVIAFNEIDKDGRFRGVRKVELDMPRIDWTFLRQRLGLYTIRRIGQPAQCANNATLAINGEYYGLYSHLERIDKEFLQRVYGKAGDADEGDLWKAGAEIRTNEETATEDRLDAFWSVTTPAELSALAPIDDALVEWASEAILPHSDGYHFGRHNFFLYDHPAQGFLWIPSDVDTAFDYSPYYIDLIYPRSSRPRELPYWIPYSTVLNDPAWVSEYVDTLDAVWAVVDPQEQAALIDAWAEQIASAAEADPHRSFSVEDHDEAIEEMREYLALRHDFVGEWVTCRRTGAGYDWDGDGAVFCFDCNEDKAAVHPGAVEMCNQLDDDCDGIADEEVTCP